MFGQDRHALRAMYREAWEKRLAGAPMSPLQTQIADVIAQHPEYAAAVADDASEDQDFDAAVANPYLHLGLHLALRDQLATDRPHGIRKLYENQLAQGHDSHTVQHRFMECLGTTLWEAQKQGRMPDDTTYLQALKDALRKP